MTTAAVKRRHRRLLVVNVANGNSAVDDCVVLNATPDTTTTDVLHKVRYDQRQSHSPSSEYTCWRQKYRNDHTQRCQIFHNAVEHHALKHGYGIVTIDYCCVPSPYRYYFIITVAKYCDERVCVCLSVCPRGYLRNHTRDHIQIFVHVAYGRGSVLLRQGYEILMGRCNFGGFLPH